MELVSPVLPITDSSPAEAGQKQAPWTSVRSYSAVKTCTHCGAEFRPWRKRHPNGKESVCQEKLWAKQRFCSISCSKKHANPMSQNAVRQKVRQRLKAIRHKPIPRGGNGQLLTLPQLALLHALGDGWEAEVAVPTSMARDSGYPTHYKLDLAHRDRKLGIEIDGQSHALIDRAKQDTKKDQLLRSLGWSVYRVSNTRALGLFSTFTSTDTLLTSLMESSSTTAT
jgi:hypothetical protein